MTPGRAISSWDFKLAVVSVLATWMIAPSWVPNGLVKDFYATGIAVLAIVFSVFFAALAIIMSSSGDDFVAFLEQDKTYTRIVDAFRFSLILLFIALLFSIFLYAYSLIRLHLKVESQSIWWAVSFEFLFLYSLFAALAASLDSMKYSDYRSRFIVAQASGRQKCRAHSDASKE
jgi:Na+/H+-translocating membrane pyrophosphatase